MRVLLVHCATWSTCNLPDTRTHHVWHLQSGDFCLSGPSNLFFVAKVSALRQGKRGCGSGFVDIAGKRCCGEGFMDINMLQWLSFRSQLFETFCRWEPMSEQRYLHAVRSVASADVVGSFVVAKLTMETFVSLH